MNNATFRGLPIALVTLLATMMAALLLHTSAVSAQTAPQGTLDANNLEATPFGSFSVNSNQVTAQQFTAGRNGNITQAQAKLATTYISGFLTMEIAEVQPSGTPAGNTPARVLASTTTPASAFNGTVVTGIFNEAAPVVAGQQYALVLKSTTPYQVSVSSNSYPGGWLLATFPSFPHLGWFGYGSADMVFGVYISSDPCIYPPLNAIKAQPGKATQGTAGDDVVIGTAGADEVFGNGGNDTICGRGGDDKLFGGDGNDTVKGEAGSDHLFGQAGDDTLDGGDGDDRLRGDAGKDSLDGGEGGADTLFGGAGDDRLDGDGGNDTLYGGEGNDELDGGPGTDSCSPGEVKRDNCEGVRLADRNSA